MMQKVFFFYVRHLKMMNGRENIITFVVYKFTY